ncbi:MAG: CoA transferase [Acidimicrobiia bacterium]|nr:CoA transferase [Acidimicrobiia bacterium]
MPGPLEGVKVVELGVWVAGPAAAGVMADWGADVVKIEPTSGDPARSFQFMYGGNPPDNPVFELDNRNKRGVAVDITTDEGRDAAYRLIDDADVFVTNVRAAALQRSGFDYATLSLRNPRLIYGLITGYGLSGPDADRPGFDISAFWSRTGMAHLMTPAGNTIPTLRGGMGDHSTGVTFAGAISAALFSRERTGTGQMVTSSLLRQGVYTVGFDLNMVLSWGRHPPINNRFEARNPSVNTYQSSDGKWFFVVGVEGDRHWPPLARVVGKPELVDDPRFDNIRNRAINSEELRTILDAAFATRTMDDWVRIFDTEPDMFWSPIHSPDEILNDEQLQHAGGLVDVPNGNGTTRMIASPVDFHGTPGAQRSLAPRLGEHTREVLLEAGFSDDEIDRMISSGAVRVAG